jgi:hypothetical protein
VTKKRKGVKVEEEEEGGEKWVSKGKQKARILIGRHMIMSINQ